MKMALCARFAVCSRIMKNPWLRISTSGLLCFLLVVACGPRKNEARVQVLNRAAAQKTTDASCLSAISNGRAFEVRKAKDPLSTPFCETTGGDDHAASPNLVELPLSYRIGKQNGKIQVSLDVGVELPQGLDPKITNAVVAVVQTKCLPAIEGIWKRSTQEMLLDLTFHPFEPSADYDQYLVLAHAKIDDAQKTSRFVIDAWADKAILDLEETGRQSGKCGNLKGYHRTKCHQLAFWASDQNAKFCKQVASLVGHWLSLPSRQALSGDCAKTPDQLPLNQEREMGFQDFVEMRFNSSSSNDSRDGDKAFSFDAESAQDPFWSKARFSASKDIPLILSPACRIKETKK